MAPGQSRIASVSTDAKLPLKFLPVTALPTSRL